MDIAYIVNDRKQCELSLYTKKDQFTLFFYLFFLY